MRTLELSRGSYKSRRFCSGLQYQAQVAVFVAAGFVDLMFAVSRDRVAHVGVLSCEPGEFGHDQAAGGPQQWTPPLQGILEADRVCAALGASGSLPRRRISPVRLMLGGRLEEYRLSDRDLPASNDGGVDPSVVVP